MVSSFTNVTQADQVKEVQSVIEGDILTTPTAYGVIPSNPNFKSCGPDGATITSSYTPSKTERRKYGNIDRIGKTTHKKKYTAKLIFKASDNNISLQKWCINKSVVADVDTPAASRTFLQSYKIAGVETFEILKGCHPTKTSISVSNDGEITYTVDLRVRQRIEVTTANGGIILGTGSFAVSDSEAPWKADDGGLNHFTHNEINYAIDSMNIDVDHQYAVSEPTESQLDMYAKESIRNVSGSVSVIKSSNTLLTDAFADTPRSMSIVLKAATLTLSFVQVLFEGVNGVSLSSSDSNGFIESLSFEANSVTAA